MRSEIESQSGEGLSSPYQLGSGPTRIFARRTLDCPVAKSRTSQGGQVGKEGGRARQYVGESIL